MTRFFLLLGVLGVLGASMLSPASAQAAPASAQDALQRFLNGVQTLSAKFEQVQKDEKGAVLQTTSGRMWLARPGKFRWNYEKPYQQLLVCDGKTIWLYDPDLAQVTVRPAELTLQGTPAQLLARRADLTTQFRVEDAGAEGAVRIVRLIPKSADSDFKSIELWLQDGTPVRMNFHDQLGGTTYVTFSAIKTNGAQEGGLYRFEPPPGVEVIQAQEPQKEPR